MVKSQTSNYIVHISNLNAILPHLLVDPLFEISDSRVQHTWTNESKAKCQINYIYSYEFPMKHCCTHLITLNNLLVMLTLYFGFDLCMGMAHSSSSHLIVIFQDHWCGNSNRLIYLHQRLSLSCTQINLTSFFPFYRSFGKIRV